MNKNIEVLVNSISKMIFSSERWGINSTSKDGMEIELTGAVMGLFSEDMKLTFIRNVNGCSNEIVVNFDGAEILEKCGNYIKFSTKGETFELSEWASLV